MIVVDYGHHSLVLLMNFYYFFSWFCPSLNCCCWSSWYCPRWTKGKEEERGRGRGRRAGGGNWWPFLLLSRRVSSVRLVRSLFCVQFGMGFSEVLYRSMEERLFFAAEEWNEVREKERHPSQSITAPSATFSVLFSSSSSFSSSFYSSFCVFLSPFLFLFFLFLFFLFLFFLFLFFLFLLGVITKRCRGTKRTNEGRFESEINKEESGGDGGGGVGHGRLTDRSK